MLTATLKRHRREMEIGSFSSSLPSAPPQRHWLRRRALMPATVVDQTTRSCFRSRRFRQVINHQTIGGSKILLHNALYVSGGHRLEFSQIGIHTVWISEQHCGGAKRQRFAIARFALPQLIRDQLILGLIELGRTDSGVLNFLDFSQ